MDIMTGIVFSNIMLAVAPAIFQDQTFYISPNAGPAELAGERCRPFFFNVAWQNDNLHEAMGKHVADKGYKNVYLVAPNYPAGATRSTASSASTRGPLRARSIPSSGSSTTPPSSRSCGGEARRRVHLSSRRHGHQLHQACRPGRALGFGPAVRTRLFRRRGRDPRGR